MDRSQESGVFYEQPKIKSVTSMMGSILVQIQLRIEAHFGKQDGKGGQIEQEARLGGQGGKG